MNFTHEHEELRRTLKRFIDEEINPHVEEWEEAEIFPAHEVFKKMGNLGLLGLCKPEEYGGAGLDYSYSLAMANFNGERFGLAASALGFAEACYDEALAWARQRKTFGAALVEHQVIRHKLVDMSLITI